MMEPAPPSPTARVPPWVGALEESEAVLRAALDGDALHWGLWPDDRPGLPLESAQEVLLERLAGLLPPPPATVVIVGWGLGAPAAFLAARGWRVRAVGGSPGRAAYARQRHGADGLVFADPAEEGQPPPPVPVDAVLVLEPSEPADGAAGLAEWAAGLLPVGGRLVLATPVAGPSGRDPRLTRPVAVATALAEAGFVTLEQVAVDQAVAPTAERLLGRLEARRRQIEGLLGPGGSATVDEVISRWRERAAAVATGEQGYGLWSCRLDEIRVRACQPGDEHRILPLFEGVFYHRRSLEHWAWKYRDHPLGGPNVAVGVAADGALAAHFAAYPVPFRSAVPGLADCRSMQVGDTMTHPAFRRKGLGRTGLLARVAHYHYDRFCRGQVPFLYGFNTGAIRTLGERYLGYEYLPPIAVAAAGAQRLRRGLTRRLSERVAGWRVRRVEVVGADFDRLLDEAAPAYGLLVRRDAAWLRWRYLECPDAVHRLYEVRRRGELVGWSVFRGDGVTLRWGDALFRREPAEATAILLDGVVRQEGAAVARVAGWLAPHPAWWAERLAALGFALEPEANGLAPGFRIFDPAYGVETLGRCLYFTEGDSDLF